MMRGEVVNMNINERKRTDDGITVPAFIATRGREIPNNYPFKYIELKGENVKKADWVSLQRLDELIGDLLANEKEPSSVSVKYKFHTNINGKKQKTHGKINVNKHKFFGVD